METMLIKKVETSGLKKNYLARILGVQPNHFYQCLSGNRQLSVKKQNALKTFLSTIPTA